ncbi:unnamed protein product [Phyllotreta striolata]|uniref:Nucleolar complex protein 2 homolog n=1 Tax=Phyllotreta striolata TaxID=444603 RepID=A0A9N9TK68_PHYSR|nr:unnamed protein product [Phyllotreta striolata]
MAGVKLKKRTEKPKSVVKKASSKKIPKKINKNNIKLNPKEKEKLEALLNQDNEEDVQFSNNSDSDIDLDEKFSDDEEEITEENLENDESDDSENEASKHKQDLEKLKETDPEFYKFLQENDKKLLNFNLSDDEEDKDEGDDEIHRPADNLAVASDESDFENEDEDGDERKDSRVITHKMLRAWQTDIQTDKSSKTITTLIDAFHAALQRISSEEDNEPAYYKVDGSAVFNGVIQLCVLELGPAVRRFLRLEQGSKQPPHKCKKFSKIKNNLKLYFTDILKLLSGVTSSNIQTVLLKHLHYMSSLLTSFPNITKSITKRLIQLWGTSEDNVRVLAFFCVLRTTNNQHSFLIDTVLKSMYMTYVKNSKFVSLKSLPGINFMRRSLVEMFALDANYAYQHVFLYIRQLAIHLRNAITVNKKENIQAVYNWQFVNSLKLWGNLLSVTYNKEIMRQLIYPFVQVCIGTIKLVPTCQYYPLRFHVVQILMDLSRETGVFIPILPFLYEVLTSVDFNKKHKKVSMKPLHFTCLLRLSKSQLQENGYKDMLIETVYALALEYLSSQSHTLGFPDLNLYSIIQLKKFVKTCKNPNYNRKFKQLLEKIEQNSKFVEKERSKLNLNLNDFKQIDGWQAQIKEKKPPLTVYYENWDKLRTVKKNKQLTSNDELADYNLPVLKRSKKETARSEGPVELFPSDSEDEETADVKPKRGKRAGKKYNKTTFDSTTNEIDTSNVKDIVQDINEDDW